MLKREIKINFKSFIIWLMVLIAIFSMAYLIYPSILESNNASKIDEMLKIFPPEVLSAFNLDIASMDSAFGWLKTEGFVFVLLIIGCYSGIIGSNIILKEENDKTIEYLNSLPITRKNIVITKAIVGLIYILAMVIMLGIFNYIALLLSGEFNKTEFWLLSITPIFSSIVIYFFCMFLGTFTHKSKKMFGLTIGIAFVSYFLQAFSTMSEAAEFLKYTSVFTLADIRNVIVNVSINPVMVIVSITLSIVFFLLTLNRYNRKELV